MLIWDDVASAPPTQKENRRGIAGLIPIVKLAGAAADQAKDLDELAELVINARDNTRSVGVALAPGSIPATGKPTFELDEDSEKPEALKMLMNERENSHYEKIVKRKIRAGQYPTFEQYKDNSLRGSTCNENSILENSLTQRLTEKTGMEII